MYKQFSKKVLSSAVVLGAITTGTMACAATGQTATQTVSSQVSANAQAAINSQVASTQKELSGKVFKVKYDSQELLHDPLRSATDITKTRISGIPTPNVTVSDVSYVPTVVIPKTRSANSDQLDVSLLDDFINEISPNARHYPPNFSSNTQRYYAKEKLKELEQWLRPFAEAPNASYDVLLRAAKLNGMARNLDLGSDYAVRGSTFIAKAIDRQPNSAEANFIYGMMLSEGGGFKEGKKYLMKAASQSYKEAEQSLAQADLLSDNRPAALSRLQMLQRKHPNDAEIAKQIQIIETGKYYIWDLNAK